MPEVKTDISTIAEYLHKYFGGTIEQGMGIIEDKFRYIRFERQIKLFSRAHQLLEKRGLTAPTKIIPQKFIVPFLEAATLETDKLLQDKWSQLLANAADESSAITMKRSYISILENLTSFECSLLDSLAKHELEGRELPVNFARFPERLINHSTGNDVLDLSQELEAALNNLIRLGLLYTDNPLTHLPIWVRPTALGKEFYSACSDVT